MGSRNSDGSKITPINHSYRNLGQAITVNEAGTQADIETTVYVRPAPVIAAYEEEEVTLVKGSNSTKLTSSEDGSLIERVFVVPGETIPAPTVSNDKLDLSVVSQQPTVKVTESLDDTVIERIFGS